MALGNPSLAPLAAGPHPSPLAPDSSFAPSPSDSAVPPVDIPSTSAPSSAAPLSPAVQSGSAEPSAPGTPISCTDTPPPQDDSARSSSSASPLPGQNGQSALDGPPTPPSAPATPDVDPQIIEALRSKDRIYVLKLGETFESLITERRTRVEVFPSTSYQRLLVHRCSAYYRLTPETDPGTKALFVLFTSESRIPERRICDLVPPESTTQPAFKIMRRSVPERRSKPTSHASSVAGEDVELSDVEPSEAGSLGGRSNVTNSSTKKRMTIEEREAAYNEARSRIFMDFEKEKGKDKDGSSTSPSLNGSASAGGRSSVSDTDDVSSPTGESEWSAPSGSHSRDKRDGRRGGGGHRSFRSGGAYHSSSGGSSRNSRAPSPSFNYASLHDPSNAGHIYDPSQHHNPNMYYPNQYAYPYSPPGQGPNPPFLAPYPYYPPYNPYQSPPPMPQHTHSDPQTTTTSSGEAYPPPHQMTYAPPYGWPPHPPQPPLQSPPHGMHMSVPPQQPPQNPPQAMGPPPPMQPQSPQYHQPYMPPPHGYAYPMNPYYPPPPQPPPQGQQMPPPPPPPMNVQPPPPQQQPMQHHPGYDIPRNLSGSQMGPPPPNGQFSPQSPRSSLGNGVIQSNNSSRSNSRGPGGNNNNGNGNNGKRVPILPGRSPWSYGPGVGNGGYTSNVNASGGDVVGPRFHNQRHNSGNSSSGNSRSSHSDDVSSTSSSTTSSSSRRTYTSTTSSQQHPLPARPDWAVGLKAQPTLAATGGGRHHPNATANHDTSRTMSPMLGPHSGGHTSPMLNDHRNQNYTHSPSPRHSSTGVQHPHPSPPLPLTLQSTDFPPLNPAAAAASQEKRTPIASGAWGQSRPVLSPTTNGNIAGPAGVNAGAGVGVNVGSGSSSNQASPVARQDENNRGHALPGKPGELYSPKLVRRPQGPNTPTNGQGHQRTQSDRGGKETATGTEGHVSALANQVSSMSLGEGKGAVDAAHPASTDSPGPLVAPPPASAPAVSSPSV
ncbi:hypothetical protein CVT26_007087 [Gymnopilus dilepis]|uniref:SUZ domain-containing protein n=1 Tax=Gymnopilus dilepis TaxID=231916 RepID=A0A409VNS1_9AGAR|nr:hypothetical protein CVT26_007087 [Gymnopilus dilepis]